MSDHPGGPYLEAEALREQSPDHSPPKRTLEVHPNDERQAYSPCCTFDAGMQAVAMDPWVVDLLKQLGGLGLAVVVVYWNRIDTKEQRKDEREDKLHLAATLDANTKALTELTVVVRSLTGRRPE